MSMEPQDAPVSTKALWIGRVVSTLPVLMLLMSAAMKFAKPPEVVEGFTKLGYDEGLALGLGILELACTFLYVVPRTAVLGAVLLTGYLGGAVATHVRVGDPFFMPILLGIFVWGGLYLRDARVRALLPLRSDPTGKAVPGCCPRLKTTAGVLAALVVILVIVVTLQPSDFRVVRSTTMAAPPAVVFEQINDFRKWEAWSPWAKLDPNVQNTFEGPTSGAGAVFKWSGNKEVGKGQLTILDSKPNERVRIKLDFIEPIESTATTEFVLKSDKDETKVTWSMFGKNDLMSKAFHLVMNLDRRIGGDFEKGLAQMKAIAEAKK